jgi:formamidopyrimidine-DNA glycosylase
MPELPDLEYVVSVLGRELPGQRIERVRVKNPIVLRLTVPGTLQEVCAGQAFGPAGGTTIRVEGVRGHDAFFCPTCQPNRPGGRLGRRQLVDWSRLGPSKE